MVKPNRANKQKTLDNSPMPRLHFPMDRRHHRVGQTKLTMGERHLRKPLYSLKRADNRLVQILEIKGSFSSEEITNRWDNLMTLTMEN